MTRASPIALEDTLNDKMLFSWTRPLMQMRWTKALRNTHAAAGQKWHTHTHTVRHMTIKAHTHTADGGPSVDRWVLLRWKWRGPFEHAALWGRDVIGLSSVCLSSSRLAQIGSVWYGSCRISLNLSSDNSRLCCLEWALSVSSPGYDKTLDSYATHYSHNTSGFTSEIQ